MAINERASSDARHARTGKDAGLYDGNGTLLASMETFASKLLTTMLSTARLEIRRNMRRPIPMESLLL